VTGWLRNVMGGDKAYDSALRTSNNVANATTAAGDTYAQAIRDAATSSATGYREGGAQEDVQLKNALSYLMGQEEMPNQVRGEALKGLLDYQHSAPKTQDELIADAMNSPLYKQIMGTKTDALDSIARYASSTGGLRSGNTSMALGRESQKISERALTTAFGESENRDNYLREHQLSGLLDILRGTPSNANSIAGLYKDIGTNQNTATINATNAFAGGQEKSGQALAAAMLQAEKERAGGATAANQAESSALNNAFSILLGGAKLGVDSGYLKV
jgi:uncharacterized protein YaaQ